MKALPLDLHVLGTPPAFILSQDQTLQKNSFYETEKVNLTLTLHYSIFNVRFLQILSQDSGDTLTKAPKRWA